MIEDKASRALMVHNKENLRIKLQVLSHHKVDQKVDRKELLKVFEEEHLIPNNQEKNGKLQEIELLETNNRTKAQNQDLKTKNHKNLQKMKNQE